MRDKTIEALIRREERRQRKTIDLIASENFVSQGVLRALGSVFTNKYAEGKSHLRYYGGNGVVDELEDLVKERALKLFIRQSADRRKWDVNVQALSGSPANIAVYHALVPVGGKIMGMRLDMGGHLTHGHKASVAGKLWGQVPYGVDRTTERLDYEVLMKLAKRAKPDLIVTGYSAYSRIIDFKKFRKIADAVGAILLVDMSHFAGLVAGGVYPSPFSAKGGQAYADVVMTTTHKTLRGPRAALIFSKKKYSAAIDKAVFPGLQGGPHMNTIAAIGVALHEASQPAFKKYARQVVKNAKALASALTRLDWRVVSGGTDTHLFLMDTASRGIGGKLASEKLERAGIIVNKNMLPYDTRTSSDPSGIRIGTAAVTTRGAKEKNMVRLAWRIDGVLKK
ncbi:MAG: serine hydroxymethyltransferase [Candidatus Jorgensenbacteria bacterium]|nr:serine hydroxymethyltransferase [Candidatus Jorgensenbacteria bacterium]